MRRLALIASLLVLLQSILPAQTEVNVQDASSARPGHPLPALGCRRVTTTRTTTSTVSDGRVNCAPSRAGPYTVTVTAPGFSHSHARHRRSPDTVSVEFVLQLGGIQEAVNVDATVGYASTLITTAKPPRRSGMCRRRSRSSPAVSSRPGHARRPGVVRFVPGVGMGQGEATATHRFRGNSTTADFFVDGARDDVQYFRATCITSTDRGTQGTERDGVRPRRCRRRHQSLDAAGGLEPGGRDQSSAWLARQSPATFDLNQPISRALATRFTGMYEIPAVIVTA